MSSEAIDIVVSENGSRTVKRNLDDLATSAEQAAHSVDDLGTSSGKVIPLHSRHTSAVIDLKREMAGSQRTVNFFAGALNDLVPASSAAGEGLRVLGSGLVSGFGIGLAIEAVMAGLKLLGESLNEQKKEAFDAADATAKYAGILREGREAVEDFVTSLGTMGKGETFITGQMRSITQETGKLGDEITATKVKIAAASGWWDGLKHAFGAHTEVDELTKHLDELNSELVVLGQKRVQVTVDYEDKGVKALIESEERQRSEAANRAAASISDASMGRSRGQVWTREQTAEIEAQTRALGKEREELEHVKASATTLADQAAADARLKAIDKQVAGYEELTTKLGGYAHAIDVAQGKEVAYRTTVEQGQASRRTATEIALLGATEEQAIQVKLSAALVEEHTKRDRTLAENAHAGAAERLRIVQAYAQSEIEARKLADAQLQQLAAKEAAARATAQYQAQKADDDAETAAAEKKMEERAALYEKLVGSDTFAGTAEHAQFQVRQYQAMYAEIDELRQHDLISAQAAERAKTAIALKEKETQLQGTHDFLSTLGTMQNSSIRELAVAGKMAAIADATMNAYVAMNKALGQGGAFGFAMAAAVGAAAFANVAQIAGITGFESGGYTGDLARDRVAGVVHGQEFVSNAGATKKYRPLLEAMNAGTAPSGAGGSGGGGTKLSVSVVNNAPGVQHQVRQLSANEVEIIARSVVHRETPRLMESQFGDANSRASRSLASNTTASPRR